MIIAVNTRLRKEEQPEGYQNYLFALLDHVTKKNTQHRFLYIFDKPPEEELTVAKNVQIVITGPETGNSLRLQYWFNFKIPLILRRYKADVFVSMEGICSMRTKKPQCLLLTDLSFLQGQTYLKNSRAKFYKKFTPSFLLKAKTIATVSVFSKAMIAEQYKIHAGDITVISPGIDGLFKPIEWEEKELIRNKYSEGRSYFLFCGEIDHRNNLINLLKAFSVFKKRQKSNMMLLLAGTVSDPFKKELKSYVFRKEVKLLENLNKADLAKIIAAAYAMVYPVINAGLALPPLQAMRCRIPVIASETGALPSLFGKAALYADPEDFKDLAENMMLIFKDEGKAAALVNAGNALSKEYQWGKSADLLMQNIGQAVNN